MRDTGDVFHVAIPVADLDEAQHFYVTLLGCKLARTYPDRITIDFFGDQLVCHLTDLSPRSSGSSGSPGSSGGGALSLYPRHFGVTFRKRKDFDRMRELVELRKVPVFMDVSTRFEGTAESHRTLVLRDPSDNLIEFKHYRDPRMMY